MKYTDEERELLHCVHVAAPMDTQEMAAKLLMRERAEAVAQYKVRLSEGFYVICKFCGHPDTRSGKCEHEAAL